MVNEQKLNIFFSLKFSTFSIVIVHSFFNNNIFLCRNYIYIFHANSFENIFIYVSMYKIYKITFCREIDLVATFFTADGNILSVYLYLLFLLFYHTVFIKYQIYLLKYQVSILWILQKINK